jgi:hypothetical protein
MAMETPSVVKALAVKNIEGVPAPKLSFPILVPLLALSVRWSCGLMVLLGFI